MGRGVGAGAKPVTLEDRRGHARRRGLPVRAEHVDRVKAALRRAQRGHHPPHAVEPEAHPEQLERAQVILGPRLAPRRRAAARPAAHQRCLRRSRPPRISGSSSRPALLGSSLRTSLRSSSRSLLLRFPTRPRDSRTKRLRRARSFCDSALQRLPTTTTACSIASHGRSFTRSSFDFSTAAMVATSCALRRTPRAARSPRHLRARLR